MNAGRVCLISPGHLSTNPRLIKEATALTEAGYDVSVVCGRFAPWGREYETALADTRWRICYVPFGPFEASRSTYLLQSIRRRVARTLVRAGSRKARFIEAAHAPAVPGLCKEARSISADLYIAHYVAALPAAASAARLHGARYAFDAEDFHLGDLPDTRENNVERKIIRDIESRYLSQTAYMTAASPMIAEAYVETYGVPQPTTVFNVFPRASAPEASSAHGSAAPGPSLYWFSQTLGPGRGLETAIEGVARASSLPHLYLRGTPALGYERQLRTLAAHHGVAERLHLLPLAAPSEMERLGSQYDVGYVGELLETRNRQIAITNKLFSYMCSGIPMLATDIPSHKAIATDLGEAITLFPVGNAAAMAAALDAILLNPARLASIRAHAWRLCQERFCWEVERDIFLRVVREALVSKIGIVA